MISIYEFMFGRRRGGLWEPHLRMAEEFAEINTEQRQACFLAQIGHETGELRFVRELWGPTAQQLRYDRGIST